MKMEVKDVLNDIEYMSRYVDSVWFWDELENRWMYGMPKIDKWDSGRVKLVATRAATKEYLVAFLARYSINIAKQNDAEVVFLCSANHDIIQIISHALRMRQLNNLNNSVNLLLRQAEYMKASIFSCCVNKTKKRIEDLANVFQQNEL